MLRNTAQQLHWIWEKRCASPRYGSCIANSKTSLCICSCCVMWHTEAGFYFSFVKYFFIKSPHVSLKRFEILKTCILNVHFSMHIFLVIKFDTQRSTLLMLMFNNSQYLHKLCVLCLGCDSHHHARHQKLLRYVTIKLFILLFIFFMIYWLNM